MQNEFFAENRNLIDNEIVAHSFVRIFYDHHILSTVSSAKKYKFVINVTVYYDVGTYKVKFRKAICIYKRQTA